MINQNQAIYGSTNPKMSTDGIQRLASIIGLNTDKERKYRELHANAWPGVVKRLKKSNIQNYSIYTAEIDGKQYLFSYFEYTGNDFQQDMQAIEADSETQKWWRETDPCQIVLEGLKKGERWKPAEQVFWLK